MRDDPFDPPTDNATNPGHYNQYEIEPIEFLMKNGIGYAEANVIKYVCRHEQKNGAEDIAKAMTYLEFILKYKYGIE